MYFSELNANVIDTVSRIFQGSMILTILEKLQHIFMFHKAFSKL